MEDPGWDHTKKYFRKIMNSFALGLLWMLATVTAGFYFRLAYVGAALRWQNAVFYLLFLCSFAALLWYLYRTWKHP
jgi:FtsH-binding integral membrane protein